LLCVESRRRQPAPRRTKQKFPKPCLLPKK